MSEEVKDLLDEVKKKIDSHEFTTIELDALKEELQNTLSHKHSLDPEAIKCLFTGWWVRTCIKDHGLDPDNMAG